MHEGIFAESIINEAKKHGKVKKIIVEVGDLAHLPAKDLLNALKARVDWEIEIIEKRHEMTRFECPKCGNLPEILEGDQIILRDVLVE